MISGNQTKCKGWQNHDVYQGKHLYSLFHVFTYDKRCRGFVCGSSNSLFEHGTITRRMEDIIKTEAQ